MYEKVVNVTCYLNKKRPTLEFQSLDDTWYKCESLSLLQYDIATLKKVAQTDATEHGYVIQNFKVNGE